MELYNTAAERAVLAGILQHGSDGYVEIEDLVKSDFFYIESNQAIFKCIKNIFDQDPKAKLDVTSIISSASDIGLKGFFGNKQELEYLRSINNLTTDINNIKREAVKVIKLAAGRALYNKLIEAQKEILTIKGTESLSSIIGIGENKIAELDNFLDRDTSKTELIGKDGDKWLENILANPNKSVGINTGFPIYDDSIGGGIRRKTVGLIVARSKAGKSSITDTVALYNSAKNIPVLNLDTEMDKEQHLARIIASMTDIPIKKIESGVLTNWEKEKAKKAIKQLGEMPYHYRCVAGYDFEDILSVIKRWIIKEVGVENGRTRDCLVIYDYFKLMGSSPLEAMQEYQALGFQLSTLTNFAIKYDFPCLSFAQTNRDGVSGEGIEVVASSDRLSWFAAHVSLFKKKTPEEIKQDGIECGNRKLIPLVARHGPGLDDGDYIHMNMKRDFCQIYELGTKFESYKVKKTNDSFEVEDTV